jgi:hypothetical protein
VEEFIEKIEKKSSGCRSEEELRHIFLSELEILSRKLGLPFQPRMEETIQMGRVDARLGAIIYEFKKPYRLESELVRKEALTEIQRYLESARTQKQISASKLQGLVTDGKYIAFLAYNPTTREFVTVDIYERPVKEEDAFYPIHKSLMWFERSLNSLSRRELSPENLLEDFGPDSTLCSDLIKILWDEFHGPKSPKAKQPFYEQWRMLFSTATQKVASSKDLAGELKRFGIDIDSFREYRKKDGETEAARVFLFVIHTYYSLILKLLAVRIADELRLLGPTSLIDLMANDPKEGLKQAEENLPKLLANFIERDVFSWFLDSTNPFSVIGHMARRLKDYDIEGVRRDVLKRVYQIIIPQKLRKSLGEFYTKDWAAELLLDEVGYDGKSSLLDPACGSGTFLALAIQRKKAYLQLEDPQEALDNILRTIVGFDINPIAVTTARMNYLLALLDILKQIRLSKGVNIPVYLCDSVRIPTERPDISVSNGSLGQSYLIQTAVGEIRIPVMKNSHLELTILRTLKEYSTRSADDFLKACRDRIGEEQEHFFRPVLRGLHKKIEELEKQEQNGVWAGLVENFFAPLLVERFDFVVGNPPWVAPIHVPKEYRDGVRRLVANSGFQEPYLPEFKVATARFPGAEKQYAACLPFVHLALNRYLKPGGKCAFLLTSSLIRLLHSGGWRREMLDLEMERIVDMTLITDIHEGATCWSFIPVVVNKETPRECELIYKFIWKAETKGGRRKRDPEEAPTLLERSWKVPKKKLPLDLNDSKSPWFVADPITIEIFRRMQRAHPRLGDTYRISMGIKTSANDYYALKNVQSSGDFVVAENLKGQRVTIEKELVYPVCKGKHLRAWTFGYTHFIIPHRATDWKPITKSVLRKRYPEAFEYFEKKQDRLMRRTDYSKGPFYMIFRISKEKAASWRVAYAYTGVQLEACVIPERIYSPALGLEKELIVEETAYFVATANAMEAFYVAGFLNSLPLRAYVQSFAKPKGFPYFGFYQWNIGILPLPRFDKSNPLHVEIAEISKEVHEDVHLSTELNEKVSKIYHITDQDLKSLKTTFAMLRGKLREKGT